MIKILALLFSTSIAAYAGDSLPNGYSLFSGPSIVGHSSTLGSRLPLAPEAQRSLTQQLELQRKEHQQYIAQLQAQHQQIYANNLQMIEQQQRVISQQRMLYQQEENKLQQANFQLLQLLQLQQHLQLQTLQEQQQDYQKQLSQKDELIEQLKIQIEEKQLNIQLPQLEESESTLQPSKKRKKKKLRHASTSDANLNETDLNEAIFEKDNTQSTAWENSLLPLHTACFHGNLRDVKTLVANHTLLLEITKEGFTALHSAIFGAIKNIYDRGRLPSDYFGIIKSLCEAAPELVTMGLMHQITWCDVDLIKELTPIMCADQTQLLWGKMTASKDTDEKVRKVAILMKKLTIAGNQK
ncbi:MAG: ankyrin repeat domain-containing protein [Alphaproteobacteria bacterium]|nr:ankyrin repeat domain-containing protein [Alphaproteobacteria bacterium]